MNRTLLLPMKAMVAFLLLLQVSSCRKIDIDDFLHPDNLPRLCRIKTITDHSDWSPPVTYTFYYNKTGDPVRITNNGNPDIDPTILLEYDSQRRLKRFLAVNLSKNTIAVWSNYVWKNGRIAYDTLRYGGTYENGVPVPDPNAYWSTFINTYTYDNYGRITREVTDDLVPVGWPLVGTDYEYDNKGNLYMVYAWDEYSGGTPRYLKDYDDKTHIRRTHPVWMFLNRDYSVNNWKPATGYNKKYKLPLGFSRESELDYTQRISDLFIGYNNADIEYDCR